MQQFNKALSILSEGGPFKRQPVALDVEEEGVDTDFLPYTVREGLSNSLGNGVTVIEEINAVYHAQPLSYSLLSVLFLGKASSFWSRL